MLPQSDAMPMLQVPPDDYMPEEAAPLAEPDTELNAEPDAGQAGLYELWPPESDGSPHGFTADQLQQLYLQLSHHCQLMIEVYALAACNSEHQEAAVIVSNLLADYQVGACSFLPLRQHGSVLHCKKCRRVFQGQAQDTCHGCLQLPLMCAKEVIVLLMTLIDCFAA